MTFSAVVHLTIRCTVYHPPILIVDGIMIGSYTVPVLKIVKSAVMRRYFSKYPRCAPQLFDALVNRSIVRATGEQYGMIERC
jgi:hypothetical protein